MKLDDYLDLQSTVKFLEQLPECNSGETYYLCLAIRNKYISNYEKQRLGITQSKMFSYTFGRHSWETVVRKLYSGLLYKRTSKGFEIPPEALVAYLTINPRSLPKALSLFTAEFNRKAFEQVINSSNPNWEFTQKAIHDLYSCAQRCAGTRYFLDIDVDADATIINKLHAELKENKLSPVLIPTHSGAHILLKRDTLKASMGFELHLLLKKYNEEAKKIHGEVIINKNEFIPIPGTFQGGFHIPFVNLGL